MSEFEGATESNETVNGYDVGEQGFEGRNPAETQSDELPEEFKRVLRSRLGQPEEEEEVVETSETVEKTVEKPAVDEESKKYDQRFAALSRKDKELREREQNLKQMEARIQELLTRQEQQVVEEPKREESPELPLEYKIKQNPLKAMEELGITYEMLTDLAVEGKSTTDDMRLDLLRHDIDSKYSKQIEELQAKLEERERTEIQKENEQAINNFVAEISDVVKSNKDKYELITAHDAIDDVYTLIEQYYAEQGKIMDVEEAADLVEAELEKEAEKFLKLNKIRSKLEVGTKKEPLPTQRQSLTLSNDFASQSSKGEKIALSDDDRRANAIALLRKANR